MRYTRNRQMGFTSKFRYWKGARNLSITEMRKRSTELDSTFKWHREYNNVSFTHKYSFLGTWETNIFVDLYKQDSVYQ